VDNPDDNMQSPPVSLEELKEYRIELMQRLLDLVQLENEMIARHANDSSALSKELRQILEQIAAVTDEQERVELIIGDIINTIHRSTGSDSEGLDPARHGGIEHSTSIE
jgi:hypothetical protein